MRADVTIVCVNGKGGVLRISTGGKKSTTEYDESERFPRPSLDRMESSVSLSVVSGGS